MSTNTAATMEPSSSWRSLTGAAQSGATQLFLKVNAVVGLRKNSTSATSVTRNKVPIQVSFVFESPPQLSTVFVHSLDLNPYVDDSLEIIRSVDDLLLLRVNVGPLKISKSPIDCDYFVYRAHPSDPKLELLQRPHPFFHNSDVGILPRPDGHYTIAALVAIGDPCDLYHLHLFNSDTASSGWSSSTVSAPQLLIPVPIPKRCCHLHYHYTTTVIAIGGERGTMGWVDLWRGILLCDVLDPNPTLRNLPLPLPLEKMSKDNGLGVQLGYPGDQRDITFIRDKGYLKFVHMEVTSNRMPGYDAETGRISFRVDDWKLTIWSNKEMSDSLDDWKEGITVKASKMGNDHDPAVLQALENSGLLCNPPDSEEAAARQQGQGLQNLMMCQPTLCDRGEDVIYLMARKKFRHPKAWMLAVEMKSEGRLRDVVYCGHVDRCYLGPTFSSSRISEYLNLKKLKNPASIRVDMCSEEPDQAGGLENLASIRVAMDEEDFSDQAGVGDSVTVE